MMFARVLAVVALVMCLSGCGEVLGVVCARPGIASVEDRIRDQFGRPTAIGSTVTIRKRNYELTDEGWGDSLRVWVGDGSNTAGTFELVATKPWHQDVRIPKVEVPGDECGV